MNESKYRTLLETLKKDILGGKYNSGSSFPSIRALVRRHGFSKNTVQHAIDELTHQGLIARAQGRGTFVTREGAQRKLGVIVPRHAYSEIFPRIIGEFSRLAQKGGYTLLFGDITAAKPEQRAKAAKKLAKEFVAEGVAGVMFQPTYAGPGENNTGARNAGKIMLVYPASVASAFVSLSKATGDRRFLEQAERIAATYLRLQGEDGTWYLKMNAADGTPDGSNRLMPIASTIPMFETLFKATGKEPYRKAADRAFSRFDATRMADWNWEGQFEDVPPSEAYRNLTKHDACAAAIYFGTRFPGDRRRQAQMRELLRFAEDQFVCWVPPHDGCAFKSRTGWQASRTYASWQTPCVLEQYECYWPIDSSAAKLIRTYLALYRAEGNPVDLAKAKALGDTMTRVQREDGSIPTWWYNPRCTGKDWVNCMIASATALAELADACEDLGCQIQTGERSR